MPVTHFCLFSPLLHPSLAPPSCSPLVSPSVRLCQRFKRFSSLCRNSLSVSFLYLFILGKLECGRHTLMEEYESCLTVLYKPRITSHKSSPHNRRNPLSPTPDLLCFLFLIFHPFPSTFHKASVILFTYLMYLFKKKWS